MSAGAVTRLDWRFLIPRPEDGDGRFAHALILGAEPATESAISHARIAHRVSVSPAAAATGGAPDLLVVLRGSADEARGAASLLTDNGVAYFEMRFPTGAQVIRSPRRRLARFAADCGLELSAAFGVWPSLASPEVWLPLDVPGILRWYASTLHSRRTRRERLFAAALAGAAGRAAAGWGLVTKAYAAIARKPRSPARLMTNAALISHGAERVIVVSFDEAGVPRDVLKVPRDERYNVKNETEQRTLATLQSTLPPAVAAALPAPLGMEREGKLLVAREEYVEGRPLVVELVAPEVSVEASCDVARDVTRWLADFHASVATDRAPLGAARTAQWFTEPFDLLASASAPPAALGRLADRIHGALDGLGASPVPTVVRHRDFTPWNVMRATAGVRVIDWEGAGPGAPLEDLVQFLTHWHQLIVGAFSAESRMRAVVELYCEPTASSSGHVACARSLIRDYTQQLGMDRAWIPVFIAQTFISVASRHFALREPGAVTDADSFPETPLVDALGRNADALFARWSDAES